MGRNLSSMLLCIPQFNMFQYLLQSKLTNLFRRKMLYQANSTSKISSKWSMSSKGIQLHITKVRLFLQGEIRMPFNRLLSVPKGLELSHFNYPRVSQNWWISFLLIRLLRKSQSQKCIRLNPSRNSTSTPSKKIKPGLSSNLRKKWFQKNPNTFANY